MPLTGSSQEIPLVDVVQVGANNRQTCRIAVRHGTGEGELYLDRGEIVHASSGRMRGEEAAYQLLAITEARYRIEAGVEADQRTIHAGWQQIVLEAARRLDESRRLPRATPLPPIDRPWRRLAGAIAIGAMLGVLGGYLAVEAMRAEEAGKAAPAAAAAAVVEATALTGPGDAAPIAVETRAPTAPAGGVLRPTITLRVLVDERGGVADAKVYRSRLDLAAWEDAAIDAVRAWRFTPARRGGAPVAAWINVPVTFASADGPRVTVAVKGSDTIGGEHGVGPELARAFEATRPDVAVTWEGLGSSTAFVGLLDGSAAIGASSRAIEPAEVAEAERLGVRVDEYVLGYDGIAVIVHPDAPVRGLTLAEVANVFDGSIGSWAALGGADRPIRRLSRPSYSGTHAFFRDKVLGGAELAPGTAWIESTEAIVDEVARDPAAIAFVGAGWVTDEVRALAVDGVAPGRDTIRDGTYPIYRPLLLYVAGGASREALDLVRFCLAPEGQALVEAHGFVPTDAAQTVVEAPGGGAPELALRVRFAAGRATLDRAAREALGRLAADLRDDARRVLVVGHADGRGDAASNARLARRRADAVATYLQRNGVESVTVTSAGADAPVATNTDAAGRNLNRRVDVLLAAP